MKKIFLTILVVVFCMVGRAQIEKIELQASGLTCSMCSNAINKALKTLPFVETVNTDLNNNLFIILPRKNSRVDPDQIKMKVINAGFSVASFWIYLQAPSMSINQDQHLQLEGLNLHFLAVKQKSIGGSFRLRVIFFRQKNSKNSRLQQHFPVMKRAWWPLVASLPMDPWLMERECIM